MTDEIDGIIRLTTHPEDSLDYIMKLPLEERKYALKYYYRHGIKDLFASFQHFCEQVDAYLQINFMASVINAYKGRYGPLFERSVRGRHVGGAYIDREEFLMAASKHLRGKQSMTQQSLALYMGISTRQIIRFQGRYGFSSFEDLKRECNKP